MPWEILAMEKTFGGFRAIVLFGFLFVSPSHTWGFWFLVDFYRGSGKLASFGKGGQAMHDFGPLWLEIQIIYLAPKKPP